MIRPAVLFLACLGLPLQAQGTRLALDASVGAGNGARRDAAALWYDAASSLARVRLGVGIRASRYAGDRITYENRGTVRGRLTPDVAIDPLVLGINAALLGEFALAGRLAFGANLDLVGLATGPTRTTGSLTAKPEAVSSFRWAVRDRGALDSEFYVGAPVAGRLHLRAGISHFVTNYTVTDATTGGSSRSRYQRFQTVPFVAVRVRL